MLLVLCEVLYTILDRGEPSMGEKVTSIKVDDELWNEFKIEALRRRKPLADLLDEVIRKELGKDKAKGR
jgi:hypothetical protein